MLKENLAILKSKRCTYTCVCLAQMLIFKVDCQYCMYMYNSFKYKEVTSNTLSHLICYKIICVNLFA